MTGISFEANCGIDASVFKDDWHGASVMTEVVLTDFEETRASRQGKEVEPEQPTSNSIQCLLFADAA